MAAPALLGNLAHARDTHESTSRVNSSAPARPAFTEPDSRISVSAADVPFPGPRRIGYAFKACEASNVVSGVRHAVAVFGRWDIDSGRLMFLVHRITQHGLDKYEIHKAWLPLSVILPRLFDDPALDFAHRAKWEAWACSSHGRPFLMTGDDAVFLEAWSGQVASLPQDHPPSGVVMRQQHASLRLQYAYPSFVYTVYGSIVFTEAPFFRKMAMSTMVDPGKTVLEVGCGVGTVGAFLMEKASPGDRWNVYFQDASSKMVEYTRDLILTRFGQPPAGGRRFERSNIADPEDRRALKLAFNQPRGFDNVVFTKLVSHFTDASASPFLSGIFRDLVAPGGAMTFDVPLQCRYHRDVLGDTDGRMMGGYVEILIGPVNEQLQKGDLTMTLKKPPIQGPDLKNPKMIGRHFLRDADLKAAEEGVKRMVSQWWFVADTRVSWDRNRTEFHDETAQVEAAAAAPEMMADQRVRTQSLDVRRDYARWYRASQVGHSTAGPVLRRPFEATVIVRVTKEETAPVTIV